jgi:long-chain acyl-CoA synthetase
MNKEIVEYWEKNWPKETPRYLDYDQLPLAELLRIAAKKYPESQAIYFEGFRMTYKELDALVDQFATGLSKLGIKKGDVVGIDLPNIPQYVIAHWAVLRLGATSNPILPVNRFVEIVHQINDSKASTLIILDYLYEEYLLGKDLGKMDTLKKIILTGSAEYLPKIKAKLGTALGKVPRMKKWPEKIGYVIFHKYQDILHNGLPIDLPKVDFNLKEDAAILIYTGGTTGVPKGVISSHHNMIANAHQLDVFASTQEGRMEETKGNGGMLLVVPLAHSFGNIGMTVAILEGWKLILLPRPPEKLSKILKIIMKEGATYMPGVPTLYNKINQDPDSIKYKGKLNSLIACVSGASALPFEVKNTFEDITGAVIVEGYGMSECSPVLAINPFIKNLQKIGTVGFPLSDTLVKIVDAEEGKKALLQCPNENCKNCGIEEQQYIGEICGTCPQVMLGYLGRNEETAYALREEGHGVFPLEVEDFIYMHEAVLEVGVLGVPDPDVGENIKAFIALKPEYTGKITVDDLMNWCKENISPYKYPRIIEIVPELPKTVIGKILKRELRKEE